MIRLWLSREGRPPVREQLAAQLLLGILSGKLAPGERLPSVRDLARRLKIHRNTVAAVYQDLGERGWLRVRQGSGVFVAPGPCSNGLDGFVRAWSEQARSLGYSVADLQASLARLGDGAPCGRWVVIDPDADLAEIIAAEISDATGVDATWAGLESVDPVELRKCFVVANEGHAGAVLRRLGGLRVHPVGMRSVAEIVEGVARPSGPVLIGLVSRSQSIRQWAGTLLSALGFGPESVVMRNPASPGWTKGLRACDIVAGDLVAARQLPQELNRKVVFRIVSAASLEELRGFVTAE